MRLEDAHDDFGAEVGEGAPGEVELLEGLVGHQPVLEHREAVVADAAPAEGEPLDRLVLTERVAEHGEAAVAHRHAELERVDRVVLQHHLLHHRRELAPQEVPEEEVGFLPGEHPVAPLPVLVLGDGAVGVVALIPRDVELLWDTSQSDGVNFVAFIRYFHEKLQNLVLGHCLQVCLDPSRIYLEVQVLVHVLDVPHSLQRPDPIQVRCSIVMSPQTSSPLACATPLAVSTLTPITSP
mmetsp:Transcript_33944/g.80585  ORF Transcript_33944/g.80585 Transcript_33944/m.80585 type:complete len:238 (+) Transcript_33944:1089-1802(+)